MYLAGNVAVYFVVRLPGQPGSCISGVAPFGAGSPLQAWLEPWVPHDSNPQLIIII